MNSKLSKNQIERFSRQIILKDIGTLGQKKIIQSRVLIIGMGGLGCPAAEFLTRAGVGFLGIIDSDNVEISNIHRQSLFDIKDLGKSKVVASKNFQSGLQMLRQCEFALWDINTHTLDLDTYKILDMVREKTSLIPIINENRFLNSFSYVSGLIKPLSACFLSIN